MIKIIQHNFQTNSINYSITKDFKIIHYLKNLTLRYKTGIYRIYNRITNDSYIGQSKNLLGRLQEHISLLRYNKHVYSNKQATLLQNDWNKYGEKNFGFEILQYCTLDELDEREKYWIEYFQSNYNKFKKGYNVTEGGKKASAYNNTAVIKEKKRVMHKNNINIKVNLSLIDAYINEGWEFGCSEETNKRRSATIKKLNEEKKLQGYKRKVSEETRLKQSLAKKGKISNRKGKFLTDQSPEAKAKRSKPHIGRKMSLESSLKKREKLKGKIRSEEIKLKISKSKYKEVIQLDRNGNIIAVFNSLKEATQKTGISSTDICNWCKGRKKLTKNTKFMWRYKE